MPDSATAAEIATGFRALAAAAGALLAKHRPEDPHTRAASLVKKQRDVLAGLEQYRSVYNLISIQPGLTEDTRARGADSPRGVENIAGMLIITFLMNAFDEQLKLKTTKIDSMSADAYSYLVESMFSPFTRTFYSNVDVPDAIDLENGQLRRPTTDEQRDVEDHLSSWIGFRALDLANDGYAVYEQKRRCRIGDSVVGEAMKAEAAAMHTYLRMNVNSKICEMCAFGGNGSLWPWFAAPNMHYISRWRAGIIANTIINPTHLERWSLDRAVLVSPPPALALALRRFDRLSESVEPDAVVDQMIILEALFSDGPGGIKEKLSTRVSSFLAKENDTRLRIKNVVRDAYGIRSEIVHGMEMNTESTRRIHASYERISEILGEILTEYIAYTRRSKIPLKEQKRALIATLDKTRNARSHARGSKTARPPRSR